MDKKYVLKNSDALLIIDIQNDFLPGGALPIDKGDKIILVINEYIRLFEDAKAHILASRDWHPSNHMSFKKFGGLWPSHCVQQTEGARFSPNLKLPAHTIMISKATDTEREAYSAFDGTNLVHELRTLCVKRVFAGGLATDYCVVNTVLDACKLGFETIVLIDATWGINANPGDVSRAIETMVKNGAQQAVADDFMEAVDALPIQEAEPDLLEEKPSKRAEGKKKARMRSKGSTKRIRTERKS